MFSVNALGSSNLAYSPPRWVATLSSAFASSRPTRIFASGDTRLLEATMLVTIVGAREASPRGLALAESFSCELATAGVVVMSGLARGIDTAAHRATIAAGGRTVAVIGTPLDRAYPAENAALQEQIYREHLLVSPFESGTRTSPGHFPARNRLMARLARATLVVEAADGSGTMHQIAESLAIGRPVFIAEWLLGAGAHWPSRILALPNAYVARSGRDVLARLPA